MSGMFSILPAIGVMLGGCSGSFSIPPHAREVVAAPGVTVVEAGDTEVIETPAPEVQCFARARFFRGLVQKNCADIAREVRP
jgi:hypothetical protein